MTDRDRISATDLERLSAYLDGELEPSESSSLESRLRDDPTLLQALQELRRTVDTLRSLPAAAPPRDFRLNEQMIGRRSGAGLRNRIRELRLYPVMQLGTAIAGLAFVVLAGFDVLVNNSLAGVSVRREAAPAAAPLAGQSAADALAPGELQDEDEQPMTAEQQLEITAAAEQEFAAEAQAEPGAEADEAPSEAQPEQDLAAAPPAEGTAEAEEQLRAAEPADDLPGAQAEQAVAAEPAGEPEAAGEAGAEPAVGAGAPRAELDADLPSATDQEPPGFRLEGRTALTAAEISLAATTVLLLIFTLRIRRRV